MRKASFAILACGVVLAAPASSEAAVDFGSNLSASTGVGFTCEVGCTIWNRSVASSNRLLSDVAPSNGVITRYTLKHGSSGGGYHEALMHLRVVHPVGGLWQGLAASTPDVRLSDLSDTESFASRVPINTGEYVGIEGVPETLAGLFAFGSSPGTAYSTTSPGLPANGMPGASTDAGGTELLLQLHLEPDADRDGFGDETQDGCPVSATSQTVCPPRKCKKKAKRHAAESKKKKCRKKKRH